MIFSLYKALKKITPGCDNDITCEELAALWKPMNTSSDELHCLCGKRIQETCVIALIADETITVTVGNECINNFSYYFCEVFEKSKRIKKKRTNNKDYCNGCGYDKKRCNCAYISHEARSVIPCICCGVLVTLNNTIDSYQYMSDHYKEYHLEWYNANKMLQKYSIQIEQAHKDLLLFGKDKIKFGKYKYKTLDEVYELDLNYLQWIANKLNPDTDYMKSIKENIDTYLFYKNELNELVKKYDKKSITCHLLEGIEINKYKRKTQ